MDHQILVAVIASIPPTVAALAAVWLAFHNKTQIQKIHIDMNSRFDQWMETVKASSFAAGVKSETDKK